MRPPAPLPAAGVREHVTISTINGVLIRSRGMCLGTQTIAFRFTAEKGIQRMALLSGMTLVSSQSFHLEYLPL